MSPDKHITSGIILGAGAYLLTKDITLAEAAALSAFVCDFDHALEYGAYCFEYKKAPTLREFSSGRYFETKGRIVLVFHAYEYLILFTLAALITHNSIAKGTALGYALHLILDTIGNDCTFVGYWIIYRALVKFKIHRICGKGKEKNEDDFNSNANI